MLTSQYIPKYEAVVVMIVQYLDLQLPMKSVHITTNGVSSKSNSWRDVLDTTLCDLRQVCGLPGYCGFHLLNM